MKRLLYALVCLLGITLAAHTARAQQCSECVPADAAITFLGIDYTFVNFGGTLDQPEDKVIHTYIPAWNELFVTESSKYNIGKMYGLSRLSYDVDFFKGSNKKVSDINGVYKDLPRNTLITHINKISFKGVTTPYAMFLIAGDYNKPALKAVHYLVIYNVSSGKIEVLEEFTTKPQGFGFRNYWAGSFYAVFKEKKRAAGWFK